MDQIENKYLIAISIVILIACGLNSFSNILSFVKENHQLFIYWAVIMVSLCTIIFMHKKVKKYRAINEFQKVNH